MNQKYILILSILVIGVCSVPMERKRREAEDGAEVITQSSEEGVPEKLDSDEDIEPENQDIPVMEEPLVPEEVGVESDLQDESKKVGEPPLEQSQEKESEEDEIGEPKDPDELYKESKAEFERQEMESEKNEKLEEVKGEPTVDENKPLTDNQVDNKPQSSNDVPNNGGFYQMFSQMWESMSSMGTNWEYMRRMFNAFTTFTGFQR